MQYSVTFDEVKYKYSKKGKCKCGKKISRSQTFFQTLNPYNKNKDGIPKTRNEILMELHNEADNWQPDFTCNKCKGVNHV